MKCRMDHIVLNVTDMEAMLAFYLRVLELPAERLETYRAGQVPFPSVRLGADTVIDFFPEQMWAQQGEAGPCGAHLNHFCLALEKLEWDALVERLKKGGSRHRKRSGRALGRSRHRNLNLFSGSGKQPHRGSVLRKGGGPQAVPARFLGETI